NVFPIEMPPLRSRLEDLPLLVRDFIAHNIAEGRGHVQLSPRALAALAPYRWPGNLRELANLIERPSLVSRARIAQASAQPPKYRPTDWNEGWVAPPFAHEIASLGTEPPADSREERDVERATSHDREEVPAAPNAVDADPAPVSESLAPEAPVTLAASDLSELPPEGIDLRAHRSE